MRILIVEDDARIGELLVQLLATHGFVSDLMTDVADATSVLLTVRYDLAIVDLGLPDGDGVDILHAARRGDARLPVLFLTARDAVEDRVRGLDAGADDYLVKPFANEELVARIKALLRRPGYALGTVLTAGNLSLDTIGRDARVNDAALPVTRQEAAVLEHLLRRLGRVVPRDVLEERLYGLDQEPESNPIPVHIHHLRRKLADAGATPVIHTVRGVGYVLEASP